MFCGPEGLRGDKHHRPVDGSGGEWSLALSVGRHYSHRQPQLIRADKASPVAKLHLEIYTAALLNRASQLKIRLQSRSPT